MKRLLAAVLTLVITGPAMGVCGIPQPRTVCAEYFASQVVVEATLLQISPVVDKGDPEGIKAHIYELRSDKVIRGKIASTFKVYEGNDSGRAAFGWHRAQTYLLFLFYSVPDKGWELDGCGNSEPLPDSRGVLRTIDEIRDRGGNGFIDGLVTQDNDSDALPGTIVEAVGSGGTFSATTNQKGEFELRVPAGKYLVRAVKTGFHFDRTDLSYEDPTDIRIEAGGCVQLQLVGTRPGASQ